MTQPPGTGTLAEQFVGLKKQVAEHARRAPADPVCRVRLNANVSLASGTVAVAQDNWVVTEDDDGWFTPGGPGVPSVITVPLEGYYSATFHACVTGTPPGTVVSAKITKNTTDIAFAVATDSCNVPTSSGDGGVVHPHRARFHLDEDDRLYWSVFTSVAGSLRTLSFAVPTEVTVIYLGST